MRNQFVAVQVLVVALIVALFALPRFADAGMIFQQSPVDGSPAGASDFQTPEQKADNFTLASDAIPSGIRWWGNYAGPEAGPYVYQIRFFNDDAGMPEDTPFYNQTLTGVTRIPSAHNTNTSSAVFEFFGTLPSPPSLTGGTVYHVSIVDNSAATVLFWMSDGPGNLFTRFTDAGSWSTSGITNNLAFELHDVPEPSMLFLSMLALPLLRRRSC